MRKIIPVIPFCLIVFISILSCTNNPFEPATISNIPSNIIVKEKSTSGNFDSLVYDIHLYASADSIYFDSIHVENSTFSGSFAFNRSRFATQKFVYTDNSYLTPLGGDTTAVLAALFDNNNRISTVSTSYIINQNTPTYASSYIADFGYDINNRMNAFSFNNQNGNDFCHAKATGSSGMFYTNSESSDSMVITTSEASCGACWNCSDFIFVTYLPKANNTNELFLSYPTIPSLTGYPSYFNLFFLEYIPFPKMNGRLIDKVGYMRQNGFTYTYTNTYTYDTEGRVKTAKIYYFDKAREELIEFNY